MGDLFKKFPFTLSVGLVAAAAAGWFGWTWWAILLSLLAGLLVGAYVDETNKEK
jgi:uncharacterized membrane protein YjjP (DUF1212 family)